MSWNKIFSWRPSLKLKLAASFAFLFVLFCLLVFIFVQWHVVKTLNSSRDENCLQILNRLEQLYILGGKIERLREVLPPEYCPDEVLQKLEQRYPGCRLLLVYRVPRSYPESDEGGYYYTACIYHDSIYLECRVMDDGVIYAHKINVERNRRAIQLYISRLLRAQGENNLEAAVFNSDGSSFAHSGNRNISAGKVRPGAADKTTPLELYGYRYQIRNLPDSRRIVVGWNVSKRNTMFDRYRGLFVSVLICTTLVGTVGAWLLTRRFINGIKRTTLAMNRISSGDYSYRIENMTESDREIRQLMNTFNAMNERTEKLLQDIRLMSDNVAHDLRTPLTRISGIVELLLQDRSLDENVRSVCVSVAEETNRLRDMVNTLMDISRMSRTDVPQESLNLTELLRDFCDFIQPAFEDKGLDFILDLPERDIMINADKGKLQRLLSNLLENALKFTGKGKVEVVLISDAAATVLEIKDSGCGIPPSEISRVFERFYRCDSSRHYQGNGLGLALVKAICDLHKWEISVESEENVGTTFQVVMPAAG